MTDPDAPSRITLPFDRAALQRLCTTFAKAADFTRETDRAIYDALIHAMSPEGQREQLWADRGAGTWHPAGEA